MKEDYTKSLKRAKELWDLGIIDNIEVGTFQGLKKIHEYLFQDVFDFAGELRTVNISKSNFRFASVVYLKDVLKSIERMPETDFESIIEKYVEMNIAHPFREGNGRATRIWLDMMLKNKLNAWIDWNMIDKRSYLSAMERSPINTLELRTLLKSALSTKISREVFMKGIERSYEYEYEY